MPRGVYIRNPEQTHRNAVSCGKRTQELYPNLSSETLAKTHKKYPNWAREHMLLVHSKYPNLAKEAGSKGGKRCKEMYPELAVVRGTLGIKTRRQNPIKFHEECIKGGRAAVKSQHKSPNRLESYFNEILQKYSKSYRYTGGGTVWIGNGKKRNPDFTHDIENWVIELFGNYHHSEVITGIPNEQHVKETVEFYEKNGYKCLVLWEREVYELSEEELLNRIP